MKSKKELLSEALNLLHTLEDRTDYEDKKLGKAINLLQDLSMEWSNNPPTKIEVDVYYYKDDEGNRIYDEEEMQRDFEARLKQLPK